MMRGGPLRRRGDERASGIPVTSDLARDAELHVERLYRSSGYPVANSEIRWVYRRVDGSTLRAPVVDRIAGDEAGVCARGLAAEGMIEMPDHEPAGPTCL